MPLIPSWLVLHQNALSFLSQAILAALITLLFIWGQQKSKTTWLLIAFFAGLTGFLLAEFVALASYLAIWQLIPFEILLLAGMALIQFAYHFPQPALEQANERRLALALTGLIFLLHLGLTGAFWAAPTLEGLNRARAVGILKNTPNTTF